MPRLTQPPGLSARLEVPAQIPPTRQTGRTRRSKLSIEEAQVTSNTHRPRERPTATLRVAVLSWPGRAERPRRAFSTLVPTLRVGTQCRDALRRSPRGDGPRRRASKTGVPTRSVG